MTGVIKVHAPGSPEYTGILRTLQGAQALATVLVMRLGGRVVVTPEELAASTGTIFMESDDSEYTKAPTHEKLCVWIEQDPRSMSANDGGRLQ